jgi:hypothetical protein
MLNDEWSKLPPREQERRKYEIMSQLVADGLMGTTGAQALGKAKSLTEVLDVVAQQGATYGGRVIEAAKRAAGKIANLLDEINPFNQTELTTAGGPPLKGNCILAFLMLQFQMLK